MVKAVLSLSLSLVVASAAHAQVTQMPREIPSVALPQNNSGGIGQSGDQTGGQADRPRTSPMSPSPIAGPDYRIGPDDELSITVLQAPELATVMRVSQQGLIAMPLLGTVTASGLTTMELKRSIEEQLSRKYIKQPDVTILVTDARSHSVSVVGAVQHPGVVQVGNSTTLLDVISYSGGLSNDAGETVVVMHRGESGAAGTTQEIKITSLMTERNPAANIPIVPGDTVKVLAADVVYVVGAVNKPGAYSTTGNGRLTVLRALALGGGLAPQAAKSSALVVRTAANGQRVEIPVDLPAVLKGKNHDVPLEAHDLLFVPISGAKVAGATALDLVKGLFTIHLLTPTL